MIQTMSVTGLDDVLDIIGDFSIKAANNLARSTVHGVASEITKEVKKNAQRHKDSGDLIKAIKTKRRRGKPGEPVSDVIALAHGFYWRFIEHGTGGANPIAAQPFVMPARELIFNNIDGITQIQFSKKLESQIRRELNKQAKKANR